MRNTEGRHQTVEDKIKKMVQRVEAMEKKLGVTGHSPFSLLMKTKEYEELRDQVL